MFCDFIPQPKIPPLFSIYGVTIFSQKKKDAKCAQILAAAWIVDQFVVSATRRGVPI
jgi:hypothetical protein